MSYRKLENGHANGHAKPADVAPAKKDTLPPAINEEDWEKYQLKAGVLFPTAPYKFTWDLVVLVLILYSAITVPFRLAMNHPAGNVLSDSKPSRPR